MKTVIKIISYLVLLGYLEGTGADEGILQQPSATSTKIRAAYIKQKEECVCPCMAFFNWNFFAEPLPIAGLVGLVVYQSKFIPEKRFAGAFLGANIWASVYVFDYLWISAYNCYFGQESPVWLEFATVISLTILEGIAVVRLFKKLGYVRKRPSNNVL